MPTPHIEASKEDIAPLVLMPGDPLRAKMIAETFLEDYKLVNSVRNMFAYTGTYKGVPVTVFASGMGMASMGIYSYELFSEYDVDYIIRVGSCGTYTEDIKIRDLIIVESAYSDTTYDEKVTGIDNKVLYASKIINDTIINSTEGIKVDIHNRRVFCSDVFYGDRTPIDKIYYEYGCVAVEMESFALFQNANLLNKDAGCILTVSDNVITHEATTSEERQNSFKDMVVLALESIIKFHK